MSDILYPFGCNISANPNVPISRTMNQVVTQLCGIDREARVLRYMEKRKNQKFEKIICDDTLLFFLITQMELLQWHDD
jgi:hypothetical protein